MLSIRGLRAGYGVTRVLHGIDLQVDAGQTVVLLGANGVGKTTTLRAVSGLIRRTGQVRFDGHDITSASPVAIARRGLGHVPQGRGTMSELTVEENLRAGGFTRRGRDLTAAVSRWYQVFPQLGQRRTQPAGNLSGGEQQMLALARAFMAAPRLVLLDEPSLGLAPVAVADVFRVIESIKQESGTALLLVEQNAQLAMREADYAYVMAGGQIVMSGPAAQLRTDDSIRAAYLGV